MAVMQFRDNRSTTEVLNESRMLNMAAEAGGDAGTDKIIVILTVFFVPSTFVAVSCPNLRLDSYAKLIGVSSVF